MNDSDGEIKAKVFISCGQREQSDEACIAQDIEARLRELHYDPYVAVEEQSPLGVKENILGQLESSEYFLFIDFKREQFANETFCRGSLFSHQELAIASYLNIELVAFQEEGVKKHDGLMGFLHINAIPFTDRKQLPDRVVDEIQKRWNPRWKNRLLLEPDVRDSDVAFNRLEQKWTKYFHVRVKNLNPRKMATNCYAYLERVRRITENADIPIETIEFKWSGYTLPNAVVGAGSSRSFDAFYVLIDDPGQLCFRAIVFSDATSFIPTIPGTGDFHLTYLVISENFPPARRTFKVHVSERLQDLRFEALDE
ncbi:MAG: hypothetical protein ACLPY5_08635 [Candidatus Bathyarchaeia archaeon]